MKKLFLSIACAWLVSGPALAESTASGSVFSSDTFTIARAVKLSRGGSTVYGAMQIVEGNGTTDCVGPHCSVLPGQCRTDEHCAADEKCQGNECVSVCAQPKAKPGMTLARICAGKMCVPSVEIGGEAHKYSCVQCTTDAHCSSGKVCGPAHTCVDPCSTTAGQACSAEGLICDSSTGTAKCVECTTDSQCGSGKYCNTARNVCLPTDPCDGVTCGTGKYCNAGQCLYYARGEKAPNCSSPKVANGTGGCELPCDGVTCPAGKVCKNGTDGTACCGDCSLTLVRPVLVNGKTVNKTVTRFMHPQLRACFPLTIKEYPFKKADFKLLLSDDVKVEPKFERYTGIAEAVITVPNLPARDFTTYVRVTDVEPAQLKTLEPITLQKQTVNPVLLETVRSTDETLSLKVDNSNLATLQKIAQ